MPKGQYRRTIDHCLKIKFAKLNSGYHHPDAVKKKISVTMKKVCVTKKKSS